jgi:hypothetical protein
LHHLNLQSFLIHNSVLFSSLSSYYLSLSNILNNSLTA